MKRSGQYTPEEIAYLDRLAASIRRKERTLTDAGVEASEHLGRDPKGVRLLLGRRLERGNAKGDRTKKQSRRPGRTASPTEMVTYLSRLTREHTDMVLERDRLDQEIFGLGEEIESMKSRLLKMLELPEAK